MRGKYKIILVSLIAIMLTAGFVLDKDLMTTYINAESSNEDINLSDSEARLLELGSGASVASPSDASENIEINQEDFEDTDVIDHEFLDEINDLTLGDENQADFNDGESDDSIESKIPTESDLTDSVFDKDKSEEIGGKEAEIDKSGRPHYSQEMIMSSPAYAADVANPVYRSVGSKRPMANNADWWKKSLTYITNTFGVTDGVYNTVASAPDAGSVWCAGLVSRVIHNNYPSGSSIAVTESVAVLYDEIVASKQYDFIGEGDVSNFVDIIEKTKAGDIMLLMSKNADGSWKWTHTNLITSAGYIYSQGAGGKVRMNTFDNYNQYGAYEANVSAGYHYYIYRQKSTEKSYIAVRKLGNKTEKVFNDVWFEAYDKSGKYLGALLTGHAQKEKGGYAYYLRKSTDDMTLKYEDGSVELPVGSTVYLFEQGVKTSSGFQLPEGASGYVGSGTKEKTYVKGPQNIKRVTITTVSKEDWNNAKYQVMLEPEIVYGPLTLKKKTKAEYSLYTQDESRFTLAGAKYKISKRGGGAEYYLVTNANGDAILLDEEGASTGDVNVDLDSSGTYYCWETSPSKGYKLDPHCNVDHKKSVVIDDDNRSGSFVSEEIPDVTLVGGIQIIKRPDSGNISGNPNYSLEATYNVSDSAGKSVGTIRTNKDGYGAIYGLASGTYTVKEAVAGLNYELDPQVYTVKIAVAVPGTYVYNNIDYSAVFDPVYYKARYSDMSGKSNADALAHFATTGLNSGRRANEYFDVSYYAKKIGKTNRAAFEFYLGYGMYQREPAAAFDSSDKTASGVYGTGTSRPIVISNERPKYYDVELSVEKVDAFTGTNTTQGSANLAGAEFRIDYFKTNIGAAAPSNGAKPERSWVVETKKDDNGKYIAKLSKEYLAKDFEQSEFYYNSSNKIVMPFGYIKIEEVKAPKGYELKGVSYASGTSKGIESFMAQLSPKKEFNGQVIASEFIKRGDIRLNKISLDKKLPMSGISFEIKNKETGDSLIVTTDKDGNASTEGYWMSATSDGKDLEQKDGYGALPYGTYEVRELRSESNEDYQLAPSIIVEINDEYLENMNAIMEKEKNVDQDTSENLDVDMNEETENKITRTFINAPNPTVHTTARIKDSESKIIPVDKKVTFVDKVEYKYLKANTTYTLHGTLMLRNEDGTSQPFQVNGKTVTATKTFTTDGEVTESIYEKCGYEEMTFEDLDVSGIPGKTIVVFEKLYLGDCVPEDSENENPNGSDTSESTDDEEYVSIFPLCHEDIDCEEQSLHVGAISTQAHSDDGESQEIEYKDEITIVDSVRFSNLSVGDSYKVVGTLMDKNKEEPIIVNGEKVVATSEFTAEETNGTVDVLFKFSINDIAPDQIVVYESLYGATGELLVEHNDINNTDQTVKLKKVEEPETEVTTESTTEKTEEVTTETKISPKDTISSKTVVRKTKVAKTGDGTKLQVIVYLLLVSGCAIGYILYRKKKK